MNEARAGCLAVFVGSWILAIAWSVLFSRRKSATAEKIREGGAAILAFAGGTFLVGFVSNGFEDAGLGYILLIVLGLGVSSILYSSMTIGKSTKLCNLFGHKWNGCTCVLCGTGRDMEHRWTLSERECIERCSICSKKNHLEHTWNGCKCERCGINRGGEWHKWEYSGDCIKKCSICGLSNPDSHEWGDVSYYRKQEAIAGTGIHVAFRYKFRSCRRCNIKMDIKKDGMYCPECDETGEYSWTGDGDHAEFQFHCSRCGYKIEKEYRDPNSALGRT